MKGLKNEWRFWRAWFLSNCHESGFIFIQVEDEDCEPLLWGYEHTFTQIKKSVGLKKFLYTDSCPKCSHSLFLSTEIMLGFQGMCSSFADSCVYSLNKYLNIYKMPVWAIRIDLVLQEGLSVTLGKKITKYICQLGEFYSNSMNRPWLWLEQG